MWIFVADAGFFSIVKDDSDLLVVRARVRSDLDALRTRYLPALSATEATSMRDYPYRGYCRAEDWAFAVARIALSIRYRNFKAEVLRTQGEARELLYARVWTTMLGAEENLLIAERSTPPARRAPPGGKGRRRSRSPRD